eukprot:7232376-Alexandrium_andersonii.AAC.1
MLPAGRQPEAANSAHAGRAPKTSRDPARHQWPSRPVADQPPEATPEAAMQITITRAQCRGQSKAGCGRKERPSPRRPLRGRTPSFVAERADASIPMGQQDASRGQPTHPLASRGL